MHMYPQIKRNFQHHYKSTLKWLVVRFSHLFSSFAALFPVILNTIRFHCKNRDDDNKLLISLMQERAGHLNPMPNSFSALYPIRLRSRLFKQKKHAIFSFFQNFLKITGKDGCEIVFKHDWGGGSQSFLTNYLKNTKRVIIVVSSERTPPGYFGETYKIEFCIHELGTYSFFGIHTAVFLKLMSYWNISSVNVSSFVSFKSFNQIIYHLVQQHSEQKFVLKAFVHEFFSICPRYTLLNYQDIYCEVPENLAECETCLSHGVDSDLHHESIAFNSIYEWKRLWSSLFEKCSEITAPSHSTKSIFCKRYPEYQNKVKVQPHDIILKLPKNYKRSYQRNENDLQIRIAIFGLISKEKGEQILEEIAILLKQSKQREAIRFFVFGGIQSRIIRKSKLFHILGPYRVQDMPELIDKYEIDACLFPSICPETFSYVTQETIACQLPLILFDLGGSAEQAKNYSNSYIVKEVNARKMLAQIEQFGGSLLRNG